MNNPFTMENILGYIGLVFLTLRFVPPILLEIKYIRKKDYRTIHPIFILLESIASIFLLISAVISGLYPFILTNLIALLFYIILISIHYGIKCCFVSHTSEILPVQV